MLLNSRIRHGFIFPRPLLNKSPDYNVNYSVLILICNRFRGNGSLAGIYMAQLKPNHQIRLDW